MNNIGLTYDQAKAQVDCLIERNKLVFYNTKLPCEHCGNDSVYYGIYYPGSKYDTRPQISKEEAYNKLILWIQSESKTS